MHRILAITVLLFAAVVVHAFAKPSNKDIVLGRHRQASSNETCEDVYETCKSIGKCARALRKIRKHCYKNQGTKCTEEKDIMDCKKAKDVIFALAFPEKGCLCTEFTNRCVAKRNLVYANQCFQNIDVFLFRKREVEHREKSKVQSHNAASEGTESESTTTALRSTQGKDLHLFNTEVTAQFEVVNEIEEVVFGDDGFRVAPPRHRPTPSFYETHFKSSDPPVKAKTMMVEITTAKMIATDETTSPRSPLDVLRDTLLGQRSEITTDMKYRIVSIVIGSLFLFVVFTGAVCVAARRVYRSSMLYKRGKIIDQQQKRDGSALS